MRKFHKGNILYQLLYLSWPMLLGNLFQNLQSIYEIFLLGKISVNDIAAIGIAGTVILFFWSIQGGIFNGVVALGSRILGQGKIKEFGSIIPQLLIISFVSGFIYCLIVFVFQDPIFGFLGAKGETLKKTKDYFNIAIFSLLNITIYFVFVGLLRSMGNSITIFFFVAGNVFIYFLLAPVFIFGKFGIPEFGIKGTAISGLIGIIIINIYMVNYFIKKGFLKISWENLKPQKEIIIRFLKLALPAMGQGLISNLSYFILLKIVSLFGNNFIAAYSIGLRLNNFVMMLGWPIGVSGGVIVGHSLGQKLHERAKITVLTAIKVYTVITFSLTLIFLLFPKFVMNLFTSDLIVVNYGINFLRIVAPVYIMMGIALIIHSSFNGAGATHIPTKINFTSFFLIQLPLAYFLSKISFIKENGVFWAISIAFLIQAIITIIAFKDGKWLKREI